MLYPRILRLVIFLLAFSQTAWGDNDPLVQPRNVILLIGDGMGFEHLAAARAYLGRPLCMDQLQYSGQVTTQNASGSVTDSAAAGTAIATGQKVNNG